MCRDVRTAEFREIDIVKLVYSILQGDPTATPPGAGLALADLNHKGYIKVSGLPPLLEPGVCTRLT